MGFGEGVVPWEGGESLAQGVQSCWKFSRPCCTGLGAAWCNGRFHPFLSLPWHGVELGEISPCQNFYDSTMVPRVLHHCPQLLKLEEKTPFPAPLFLSPRDLFELWLQGCSSVRKTPRCVPAWLLEPHGVRENVKINPCI